MIEKTKHTIDIREKTVFDGVFFKFILKFLFKIIFKLTNWKSGPAPKITGVVIGVPHTSNWDFMFGLGAAIIEDAKIYFSIKDSWCRIPIIGSVIMWLGAIPIDRSVQGQGQVDQIAKFAEKMKDRWIYFAFTPEGTRSKVEKWKTGFYHMAQDCQLPLHLAQLDYINKRAGIFHTYQITGNKEKDIEIIQEAYKLIRGKNPDKQFPDYTGPVPQLNAAQTDFMRALFRINQKATSAEVAAHLNVDDVPASTVTQLVEMNLVQSMTADNQEAVYLLSPAGAGCLLRLFERLD